MSRSYRKPYTRGGWLFSYRPEKNEYNRAYRRAVNQDLKGELVEDYILPHKLEHGKRDPWEELTKCWYPKWKNRRFSIWYAWHGPIKTQEYLDERLQTWIKIQRK